MASQRILAAFETRIAKLATDLIAETNPSAEDRAHLLLVAHLVQGMVKTYESHQLDLAAAMEAMQRDNKDKSRATHGMCMFLCLNAAGFQLIPSTVIALRAAAGSSDPARVVVPSLIACAVSTAVAILGCRLLRRLFP